MKLRSLKQLIRAFDRKYNVLLDSFRPVKAFKFYCLVEVPDNGDDRDYLDTLKNQLLLSKQDMIEYIDEAIATVDDMIKYSEGKETSTDLADSLDLD